MRVCCVCVCVALSPVVVSPVHYFKSGCTNGVEYVHHVTCGGMHGQASVYM